MAFNNQTIGNSPETSFVAASDEIGGVQFQRVKLVSGTEGSIDPIGVSANPLSVSLSAAPAIPTAASATLSNVTASASSVSLLASNANRRLAIFVNDSDKVAYVKFGTTASATSYTYRLAARDTLELPTPVYTGAIDCIWEAGPTGAMRITEIS